MSFSYPVFLSAKGKRNAKNMNKSNLFEYVAHTIDVLWVDLFLSFQTLMYFSFLAGMGFINQNTSKQESSRLWRLKTQLLHKKNMCRVTKWEKKDIKMRIMQECLFENYSSFLFLL